MRVNVYAEEMTDRLEIISKEIDGHQFTGLRFYLHLPVTVNGAQVRGPFMHHPGDDDSSAVTFWGKQDLRTMLRQSLALLDSHYDGGQSTALDRANRLAIELVDKECGPCTCAPFDTGAPCVCGWADRVAAVSALATQVAISGLGGDVE